MLLALVFVCGAVRVSATGQQENPDEVAARLEVIAQSIEARKAAADQRIREQDYDAAVGDLIRIVEDDEEELPAAETRFEAIRQARRAYVERGREVERELRALLEDDIPPDEVVPRAIAALTSIAAMRDIIPNPNPEDAALISELQFRVQLTIDQRRFRALMQIAAEAFRAGDFVAAVRIYVDGPDEEPIALTPEQQELIRLESGLDLQRGLFETVRTGIDAELFASAREAVRVVAAGRSEGDPTEAPFTVVSSNARAQADEMTIAFAAGDFADAQRQIAEYLPQLRAISRIFRDVRDAAVVIAEQERLNAERLLTDDGYAYDWHIRFVSDLVLGRRTGTGDHRAEGILASIDTVRKLVAEEPVAAAQTFALDNYVRLQQAVTGFDWDTVRAPGSNALVASHVQDVVRLADAVALASRTAIEVQSTANDLPVDAPADATDGPPAATAAAWREVLDSIATLDSGPIRDTLTEAAIRAASAEQLVAIVREADVAYRAATPLASQTTTTPLVAQRESLRSPLARLRSGLAEWNALPAQIRTDHAAFHATYVENRISRVERYETDIVDQIATIDLRDFQTRLSSMQTAISASRTDLNATVQVAGITIARPRSGEARDRLRPLVGGVTGVRVTNLTAGDLDRLRRDASDLITRLEGDQAYVRSDARVQAHIDNARRIVTTVGSAQTGLTATAIGLMEQALARVAEAEQLERAGRARLVEVEQEIGAAQTANSAGDIQTASELLGRATLLLSTDNPAVQDASTLFEESLSNWYRASLEQFWNSERERVNTLIVSAQRSIVFTRVDQMVDDARPLVDNQQWLDALDMLEEGLVIWENVFPTQQNPSLTALLRLARTAYSQESEQVLREDLPGFSRLSQILNTAWGAYRDGSYGTAEQALGLFFTEQPLNFQARLLEVRLALAVAAEAPDRVVQNLLNGALSDADVTRAQLSSRQISDDQFDGLLELESRLSAILEVVSEVAGVSAATVTEIRRLIAQLDPILRPPVQIPPPPPDIRAEADRRIDQAEGFGDWAVLPTAQIEQILRLLNEALDIYPGYQRALTAHRRALALPNAPTQTYLDAQGTAVLRQARELLAQGQFAQALTLMDRYLIENPNAARDLEFNRLYNDLRRRQRAG